MGDGDAMEPGVVFCSKRNGGKRGYATSEEREVSSEFADAMKPQLNGVPTGPDHYKR
ncbi:MAG TPA: hypothetical protein VGN34_24945 [Ktedonobacteraceae bacterium]